MHVIQFIHYIIIKLLSGSVLQSRKAYKFIFKNGKAAASPVGGESRLKPEEKTMLSFEGVNHISACISGEPAV